MPDGGYSMQPVTCAEGDVLYSTYLIMYQGCLKITDNNLKWIITKFYAMEDHRDDSINSVKFWKKKKNHKNSPRGLKLST